LGLHQGKNGRVTTEVEVLIAIGEEMEEEFAKSANKQGVFLRLYFLNKNENLDNLECLECFV
jgi:hypothetical protein